MLINLTNHPCRLWSDAQKSAAESLWDEIVDYLFPTVEPESDETSILKLATKTTDAIALAKPQAVLCQGEMTLTAVLISQLQCQGIPCYAACCVRNAQEKQSGNGETVKTSVFRFVRFRRYPDLPAFH